MSYARSRTTKRRWTKHVGLATVAAVLAAGAHLGSVPEARAEPSQDLLSTQEFDSVYPVEDQAALVEAASDYTQGDAAAAVDLAETASTAEGLMLQPSGADLSAATDLGEVSVELDGAVTLEAEGLPSIGVSAPVGASDGELVDGVVVYNEVAPSTDLVARATNDGAQLIAILADESAPNEIDFSLDLPAGAEVVQESDGSLAIFAEVDVEQPLPEEEARLDAEIGAVLGGSLLTDGEVQLTEAQWSALEAIEPAETELVTQVQQVAAVEAPWAVDANGEALETHYEATQDGIVQVIETDSSTAFPVTADPTVIWWAKHIVACAGEIGLFAFAGVKVVAGAIKFVKWVKGLKSTSAVAKAWNQLMKHGKGGGTFAKLGSDFAKFANTVIDLLKKLAKSGWKAMKAYAKTSAARVAVLTLMAAATATAAEWIGLGNCYAVVKAI